METLSLPTSQPSDLQVDTIAAKATASGPGALGVIRLSGSLSTAILEGLTPSPTIASIPDRTATLMLLSSMFLYFYVELEMFQ